MAMAEDEKQEMDELQRKYPAIFRLAEELVLAFERIGDALEGIRVVSEKCQIRYFPDRSGSVREARRHPSPNRGRETPTSPREPAKRGIQQIGSANSETQKKSALESGPSSNRAVAIRVPKDKVTKVDRGKPS